MTFAFLLFFVSFLSHKPNRINTALWCLCCACVKAIVFCLFLFSLLRANPFALDLFVGLLKVIRDTRPLSNACQSPFFSTATPPSAIFHSTPSVDQLILSLFFLFFLCCPLCLLLRFVTLSLFVLYHRTCTFLHYHHHNRVSIHLLSFRSCSAILSLSLVRLFVKVRLLFSLVYLVFKGRIHFNHTTSSDSSLSPTF
jgi:hypothetical protein